ncbi:ATP-binding protein [Oleidesulfovibrio sp.]|uniref:PAS domain S-box protein n=1 Tax=Oleidesulfovibrio sp. TaxID=2909707 RepID=UPI003A8C7191
MSRKLDIARGKLAAVLVAVVLTVMAFFFAFDAIRNARSQALAKAQLELGRVLATFSAEVSHALDMVQMLLNIQAEGIHISQASRFVLHPHINNVLVYSKTGEETFAQFEGRLKLNRDLVELLWRELLQTQGSPRVVAVQGKEAYPQIVMYRSGQDAAGNQVLFCGLVDTQYLTERFLDGSLSTAFTVGLVRADGALLVAWNDMRSSLRGMSLASLDVPPSVSQQLLQGVGTRRIKTEDALYEATLIPSYPLYIVASARIVDVFSPLQSGMMRVVALTAGLWFAGIILVLMGYKYTVRHYDLEVAEMQAAQREELARLLKTLVVEVQLAPGPDSAMEIFLRKLCQQTSWNLGAVWLAEHEGRSRLVLYQHESFYPILAKYNPELTAKQSLSAYMENLLGNLNTEDEKDVMVVEDVSVDERFSRYFGDGKDGGFSLKMKTILRGCCVAQVHRASTGLIRVALFSLEKAEPTSNVANLLAQIMPLLGPVLESKLAEVYLREREVLFRNMYENSALVQLVIDPDNGAVLDANKAACSFYEYSRKEFCQLFLYDVWTADRDEIDAIMTASTELYTGLHQQQHVSSSGRIHDVEAYLGRVPWQGRDVLLCAAFDKTGLKQMEAALAKSEQQLSVLLEVLPLPVALLDADGLVQRVNKSFTDLFGMSVSDCISGKLSQMGMENIHEESCPLEIESVLDLSSKVPQEVRLRTSSGDELFALVHLVPLDVRGSNIFYAAFIVDLTERRRMDERLVQSEKMSSIGGLAAGMAHEINNPLGAILQGAQNIMRRLEPDRPDNTFAAQACGCSLDAILQYLESRGILRFIEGVRSSAFRAAQITANMLKFSRPCSGAWGYVPVEQLIDVALELVATDYNLKKRYDFKKIQIIKDCADGMQSIYCIASEIEQVLLNLLGNAAQAMFAAEVTSPVIIVRAWQEKDEAVIEVEDNGPGMTRDVAKRAFEPFFTTKEPGMGTGLGLAVSYFIITANHKGSISVQSKADQGAVFQIRLPVSVADCPPPADLLTENSDDQSVSE